MRVNIKRIDPTLPMPEYQTRGAAAFDLYAREEAKIRPGEIARIPSNLIIEIPRSHMLLVALRSSTPKKKPGLIVPHGIGIIDSDFRGPEDETLIQVMNVGDTVIEIEKGERFAQASFVRINQAKFREMRTARAKTRGGFGSTG